MSEQLYLNTESGGHIGKHRLYVDMDGTLAEFKSVTYEEQLFEKNYFSNLKPFKNVVGAIKKIISEDNDIEVYILSAYLTDSKYALNEKNMWLDRYLPEIDKEHRIFVPCGSDKKECIENLCADDFLLDDYTVNLIQWDPPGSGIKLINDINHTHGTWDRDCVRYDRDQEQLASLISGVVNGELGCYDNKDRLDVNAESLIGKDKKSGTQLRKHR